MYFDFNLLPFFLSISLLTVLILAIGIHFYRNYIIMAIVIPVSIFCSFVSYNNIVDVLGYPVNKQVPEGSEYLYHRDGGDSLYVYAIQPNETRPKSFTIPNTTKNKKQMQKAQKRSKAGIPQLIRMDGRKAKGRLGIENDGDYVVYDFKIDGGNIKQYNRK